MMGAVGENNEVERRLFLLGNFDNNVCFILLYG